MKLSSSSNIKKILIVFQKKAFLRFQEMEPCTFLTKLKDQKDPTPENFLCFRKQKPRKNFLYFAQKKGVFMFQETEALMDLFISIDVLE